MIKFPYGISDFYILRKESYLYLDRTGLISELEKFGKQLLFLRPRRFGKSLLLSMLANYYDLNTADDFDHLFGDLSVGKQPTLERNQYLILHWDFSQVSAQGDHRQVIRNLFNYLNESISGFALRYQAQLKAPINFHYDDAIASLESLANAVQHSGHRVYLLIDEYDNFANEVLMQDISDEPRYRELLQGEGILKTLFKVIKANASKGHIARVFITGVSPVAMSDMTSGYNVARSIYLTQHFNELCGITQAELSDLVDQVVTFCAQEEQQKASVLETMKQFYNGYRFCYETDRPLLYNPTLCFYFLQHYQLECSAPREMLDGNLAMDAGRINYIAALPDGASVIAQIIDEQTPLLLEKLENHFGIEMLQTLQQDERFMVSLLYYFGVLTIVDNGAAGDPILGVPNLVVQGLYISQLRKKVLANPRDEHAISQVAREFYHSADLQPVIDFVQEKLFSVFDNRDYRWSNELTIKTTFLTALFNDLYYIMDSEAALQRHYSDLIMVVRPSMRQYPTLKDFLFEFKFLRLSDLQLNGEQLRVLANDELQQLPAVASALQDANQQLIRYRKILNAKYQEPERLHCFAVVALGFERLVWQAF